MLLLVPLALAAWAMVIEPGRLVTDEHELRLRRWPASLDGLRVAAISDVHGGAPHVGPDKLARLVTQTNAAHPDLVVLLGDYVIHGVPGGRFMEPEAVAQVLRGLRAPLGVVAVLGNHDHWYDAARVSAAFEAAGITMLVNSSLRLRNGLYVAGVDDIIGGRADVRGALAPVPADAPVLVLMHNPDSFRKVPERVALTLAGHTHGGQVRFPWIGAPIVPSEYGQRYVRGLVVEAGRRMYVTTGVGTSILPVRFGVPPEIAVLTLRKE